MKSKIHGIRQGSRLLIEKLKDELLCNASELKKLYNEESKPKMKLSNEILFTETLVRAMFEDWGVYMDDPIERYFAEFNQAISKATTLSEITQYLERDFPSNFLYGTDSHRSISSKIRMKNIEIFNRCLLEDFPSCSEDIWSEVFRLNTISTWILFVSECEGKLQEQKDRISFQLKLYRWLKKKHNFDPNSSIDNSQATWWHYHRICDNRYKIRVETTESFLINLLKSICASFANSHCRIKLEIDNFENFIKSNFICSDSKYSIGYFPYSITYNKASEVIRFFRYLDERNFFDPISKSKLNLESLEIQLWIETVFLDAPGFSRFNIETFFTRGSYRGKNLKKFNDLEKIVSVDFHEHILSQASKFPQLYHRNKENVTVGTGANQIKHTCIHKNKT